MIEKIDETVKRKMQQALDSYLKDKNSAKDFYPCAQKLTTWLNNKATK